MTDHTLLISEFLPILTHNGVTLTRTPSQNLHLMMSYYQKNDSEYYSSGVFDHRSPSYSDLPTGSSSEEIAAVTEFYDIGAAADPFFAFSTDYDANII